MPRKTLPLDVKRHVLHEAGYKCGNPVCRTILTLDIHHLVRVAEKGEDVPENLLALCPNCHALHHRGEIPEASIRAWKMLLLSLNEAFDRRSVDILLALDTVGVISGSGECVLECAGLIADGLVTANKFKTAISFTYWVTLSNRGRQFVKAWKDGNQPGAVASVIGPIVAHPEP
jgi:hypothetical protein